jgi:hypothetical protein
MGMADSVSPYAYVANNPVNLIDPMGLEALLSGTPMSAAYWGILADAGFYTGTQTDVRDGGNGGTFTPGQQNLRNAQPTQSSYTGWDFLIDAASVVLTAADIALGGPTGEGIGPALGLQTLKSGAKEVGENFVYRGLSKTDDIASGIKARAPGAGNSEISHVAGKRDSQWISTTKDLNTATQKYGEYGVVRIDLNKVKSQVSDVSGGFPQGGRMSNWATRDQEVLIRDFIPADAITRIK